MFSKQNKKPVSGFTLIEIIISVGIVSMSLLAIIAFLGAVGQSTAETIDSAVASQIADNIRAELANENIDDLYGWTNDPTTPIELVATKDGDRVRVQFPQAANTADNDSETGIPPGIEDYDRYFLIEVTRLENSLEPPTSAGQFQQESTMLSLSVRVVWPYHVKTGPESWTEAQPEQQSHYIFNTVILRKE